MISVAIRRNKTCFYLEKCKNVTTIKTRQISKNEKIKIVYSLYFKGENTGEWVKQS